MPVTYTNRKGVTYHLCQSTTKTGKPRYVFAREPRGAPVEQIPAGFRISESANGRVMLERDRPSLLLPEEIAAVDAAISRRSRPQDYHVAVKHDQIVVSERPDIGGDDLASRMGASLGLPAVFTAQIRSVIDSQRSFMPVLRFRLADPERRIFSAERWCSLGSIDDWIDVGVSGSLAQIAGPTVARLGDDAFYEPFWGEEL
ncbi:hypothetical protein EKD04_015160 [Chloroflexales bacterium ZM16-3]|nr:hypothetical protein [Chloroflexales bacterium ZM16-3]